MRKIICLFLFLYPLLGYGQTTYYVAPYGSTSNNGMSMASPTTIQDASNKVTPGDIVLLIPGTYDIPESELISITNSGNQSSPITWMPVPCSSDPVIISGYNIYSTSRNALITVSADFNIFRDIKITDSHFKGIELLGKYCQLHNIETSYCGHTGISIKDGASFNLLKGCISHHNYDIFPTQAVDMCEETSNFKRIARIGEDADGITINGDYNIIEECITYKNSDDGIDLFRGHLNIVRYCRSYSNGSQDGHARKWDRDPEFIQTERMAIIENEQGVIFYFDGNGNGFKLGGYTDPAPEPKVWNQQNCVYKCLAYNNLRRGFVNNGNANIPIHGAKENRIINCTAYNNCTIGHHTDCDGMIDYEDACKDCSNFEDNDGSSTTWTNNLSFYYNHPHDWECDISSEDLTTGVNPNTKCYSTSTCSKNSWQIGYDITTNDFQSLNVNDENFLYLKEDSGLNFLGEEVSGCEDPSELSNSSIGFHQNFVSTACNSLYGMYQDDIGVRLVRINETNGSHSFLSSYICWSASHSTIDVINGLYIFVGQESECSPVRRLYSVNISNGDVFSTNPLNPNYVGISELQYNVCNQTLYGMFIDNKGSRFSVVDRETGLHGPLINKKIPNAGHSTLNPDGNLYYYIGDRGQNRGLYSTNTNNGNTPNPPILSIEVEQLQYSTCNDKLIGLVKDNNGVHLSFINPVNGEEDEITGPMSMTGYTSTINYDKKEYIYIGLSHGGERKLIIRGLDGTPIANITLDNSPIGLIELQYANCIENDCLNCSSNLTSSTDQNSHLHKLEKFSFYGNSNIDGIGDSELNRFKVFPNPTRDQIYIQLHSSEPQRIQLFTVEGKEIYSFQTTHDQHNFATDKFAEGLYIIRVTNMSTGYTQSSQVAVFRN